MRVPTENVKQKMQAGLHGTASETVNAILKTGGVRGFYTGYLTTVVREIPFSFIQFPIYEWLKVILRGQPARTGRGGNCRSVPSFFLLNGRSFGLC